MGLCVFVGLGAQGAALVLSRPSLWASKPFYFLWWSIVAGLVLVMHRRKRRASIAALLTMGMIAYPLYRITANLTPTNLDQVADVRYILSITSAEDTVLDGWTGVGFLRPQAYYFGFLHYEQQLMMSPTELVDNLIEALETRKPPVLIYDSSVQSLPEPVQTYIRSHYLPTGQSDIYVHAGP
jgi:hypothetical protein